MLKWVWLFLMLAVASGMGALAMPFGVRPILLGVMVLFTIVAVAMAVRSGKNAPSAKG